MWVRFDAQTNVVERLFIKKWFVVRASMIAEPPYHRCYRTRVYLETTNQRTIRCKSLEKFCADDRLGQKWLLDDWYFQPIPTTNSWLAVRGPGQLYTAWWITNSWERDIDFIIYVFRPETIITEKHLKTFAPRERLGFPELIFDSQNQQLTYNTKHGYETYDLLDGTILPCGDRPKGHALIPHDFHFKDTWDESKHFGTNCYVHVEGPRDKYSRSTNTFLIRVYTDYSGKPHHQRVVTTRGFADLHQVHIEEGSGIVSYSSGTDDFTYSPLEDILKTRDEP